MRKAAADKEIWEEILSKDSQLLDLPLRVTPHPRDLRYVFGGYPRSIPGRQNLAWIAQAILCKANHTDAFAPCPPLMSTDYICSVLADGTSLEQKMDALHKRALYRQENRYVSLKLAVRFLQYGVTDFAGRRRRMPSGFEYGQLLSPPPGQLAIQFSRLAERLEDSVADVQSTNWDLQSKYNLTKARAAIQASRFMEEKDLGRISDRELAANILIADAKRLTDYLHPWTERVGRTTEEISNMLAEKMQVPHLSLSCGTDASTYAGYERGMAEALTALKVTRAVGRLLGVSKENCSEIYHMRDLYNRLEGLSQSPASRFFSGLLYSSPLRYIQGQMIHPAPERMDAYYSGLDLVLSGLIDTFDIGHIIKDPDTLYLTAHTIGRGKR